MKTIEIQKIPINNYNFNQFLAILNKRLDNNEKTFVVTGNPELIMYAHAHREYEKILKEADYITPDGIGVVIASKIIHKPLQERVAGFDLMNALLANAEEKGLKVYLLGAKESTLEKTHDHMKRKHPRLKIVGKHHGYFDIDDEKIVNEMIQLEPDLIFVALGFPKQEFWIHKHMQHFQKGLFMGVGGSFDVWAGEVKRAPEIWIKFHLEWFYRLLKQPSRFKRMLVLPQFLFKVLKERK